MWEHTVLGELAHTGWAFIDAELIVYNATGLKKQVDSIFDSFANGTLMEDFNVTNTRTAASTAPVFWTPVKIAILAAIVASILLATILNAAVNFGHFVARKTLTGADILVLNHCWVDFLMALLVVPVFIGTTFIYNGDWQFSETLCHGWGFFRGLLLKTSGINLTALSLHQIICMMTHVLPSCRLAGFLRRQRQRQPLFILWLISLIAVVWITSLGSEVVFFELELKINNDRCTFEARDVELWEKLMLIEEVMAFWIPTITSAFAVVYFALFVTFFSGHLRQILSNDKRTTHNQLVFYSPPHSELHSNGSISEFDDNVFLIDEPQDAARQDREKSGRTEWNPSRSDWNSGRSEWNPSRSEWNSGHRIFFENSSTVTSPVADSGLPLPYRPTEESSSSSSSERCSELSRDSVAVWLALAGAHFAFVVPPHAMQLAANHMAMETEQDAEWHAVWEAVTATLITVKVCLADFLIVLLCPRFRKFAALARRR
ncbi:hypothetical protein BV898_16601 [Hypsibius exemplaris]|uniref:G-protein coupled receptors family 1 profile domain-containing protein n=1 Tax=Hypsibius exemplaris TaxID=2072580 RepID=A0A9X6NDI5_HYPEX|nr:hypothetical protein BV898_16601 [Hypsibius exemplaris]